MDNWFDWFVVTGTLYFITQIIKFLVNTWEFVSMIRSVREHDQYCEECADELMAETIKSIRDKGNDDR